MFASPVQICMICAIVILLFGAKRLPKLAKGVGEAIREFRKVGEEIEK